jgi:hypothetical protein
VIPDVEKLKKKIIEFIESNATFEFFSEDEMIFILGSLDFASAAMNGEFKDNG